ncbi:MAG: hypothetical protein ACO3IB_07780, partial [Phycisphaerales bacterium]
MARLRPTAAVVPDLRPWWFRALGGATALAFAALLPMLPSFACTFDPPGTPVVDEEEVSLPAVPKAMRVVSAYGGTHHRLEVADGRWLQTLANRLLLLDAKSGATMADLELAPRGTTGDAVDFIRIGERVGGVLEDDAVIDVDYANERQPRIAARYTRRELGILPRTIAAIDGECYIGGVGGIVRLSDAKPHHAWIDADGEPIAPEQPQPLLAGSTVSCIAPASGGMVACVGRRIVRASTGEYLGAASRLVPLTAEQGGGFAFILQATEGASVGLMDDAFRERSSEALLGTVHSVRVYDDRFFAVKHDSPEATNVLG